ncbi:MAG: cytochrome bd-I oxidase subunit CydX [Candidatus Kinetoplastibacterium crithidii]|nr:MAG: cytochrome bd-I oxidase subunit CydX [Candidatus Kinetoplastibacterium crithidii]
MWYFSWIIGLCFAASLSIISAVLFEYQNKTDDN